MGMENVGGDLTEFIELFQAALLARATMGIAYLDRSLRYFYANDRIALVHRLAPAEIIGRSVQEVMPNIMDRMLPIYERVLAGETVVDLDVDRFNRLGELRELRADYYPVYDGDVVKGILVLALDVTEENRAKRELALRMNQQNAVAAFGLFALQTDSLEKILAKAVRVVHETIKTDITKVLELDLHAGALVVRSFIGKGVEKGDRVPADSRSQAGFTLISDTPVVVDDLALEKRFQPALLGKVGAVSGVSVVVHMPRQQRPFGIFNAFTLSPRKFSADDVGFLQAIANTLASAIDRLRREEELRRARKRAERLFNANIVGVVYVDPSGRLVDANKAFLDMLGFVHGDLQTGLAWNRLTQGELPDPYGVLRSSLREDLKVHPTRQVFVRQNGESVPAFVGAAMVQDGSHDLVAFVVDLRSQVTIERALREANERLNDVLESISDAFLTIDGHWRVTYVNRRACEIIRIPAERLLGRDFREVWPTARNSEVQELFQDAVDSRSTKDVEYFVTELGRWIEIRIYPAVDSQGFTIFFHDISARKEAQAERERLLLELEEALRVRDEFLSIASHELRTPLTSLGLQLSLLRRDGVREGFLEPGSRIEKRLDIIERQELKLEGLVATLLDVSRIASGRLELDRERFDLGELAADVAERFESAFAQEGVSLQTKIDSIDGVWDRLRMDQVLTNLLSNALKYGGGNPVELELLRQNGESALLRVRDRGIGIPPEKRDLIFQRFGRAVSERDYGGLGLGLWITRTFIEAMGGGIDFQDEEGGGTCFSIELPIVEG